MAARLATRTGSLTAEQAASLDAIGAALQALNATPVWDHDGNGTPWGSITLAAKQAMRQVTTYRMADKVMNRFWANIGQETLSQAFRFAHIGWE